MLDKLTEQLGLARDKVKHLQAGAIAVVCMAAVLYIDQRFGHGPAVAVTTTLLGIGTELYQKLHHAGEPSWADAAATAVPGYLAWLALSLAPRFM